jgi:uncharacterized repeat protein (TIGR03803 family)
VRIGIRTIGILAVALILAAGAWAQTYSVLTSFSRYVDGEWPASAPVIDGSGNVFGTTTDTTGGNGDGVVYELVNNRNGTYTPTPLYTLPCGVPNGLAMDSLGSLYGTDICNPSFVYELAKSDGTYTYSVIANLGKGYEAGSQPDGTLTIDAKGRIYGTTAQGGGGDCRSGCGEVFQLTKTAKGWTKEVLHVFHLYSYDDDGTNPAAGIALDAKGNVYGTTENGGAFGKGVVFELSPPSDGQEVYTETILHAFRGPKDGCNPISGVVFDKSGNLYGAASACGLHNDGTVYRVKHSGDRFVTSVLLQFNGSKGSNPYDGGYLAIDSAGNVYGTAASGGLYGGGTVFKLASGTFAYTDLHDFDNNGTDGYGPSGVSLDSSGNLYGTTYYGGSNNQGTVWRITNP